MHRALDLLSIRKYAVSYQFDKSKFIEIDGDVVWDFSRKMYTNLRIKEGASLTVTCDLLFVPEAKIVIDAGGKLVVDGAVLKNESFYNSQWEGVEVWVALNEQQYPYGFPIIHGVLELKNEGVIENALFDPTFKK